MLEIIFNINDKIFQEFYLYGDLKENFMINIERHDIYF